MGSRGRMLNSKELDDVVALKRMRGNRLKSFRIRKDWSAEDVVKQLEKYKIYIKPQTYLTYEIARSEPDIATLIALSDIYKTSIDDIVGNPRVNIVEVSYLQQLEKTLEQLNLERQKNNKK